MAHVQYVTMVPLPIVLQHMQLNESVMSVHGGNFPWGPVSIVCSLVTCSLVQLWPEPMMVDVTTQLHNNTMIPSLYIWLVSFSDFVKA